MGFGATWGSINDDRIFIFAVNYPFKTMLFIDAYLRACPLDSEVIEVGGSARENRSSAAHESWNFPEPSQAYHPRFL